MTGTAVLDTTVFIDARGSDSKARHGARHVLDAVLNGELRAAISVETVQEAFHVMSRRAGGRADAVAFARWLSSSYPLIETDNALLDVALDHLDAFDSIGGVDAIILAGARRVDATALITRDKGLGSAAGDLWIDSSDSAALSEYLNSAQ